MLGVGDSLKEAIGGAQNWNPNFRPVDQRGKSFVMALAGFAEEHGFDRAAGTQRFFHQAHAFDADEAGFGRQSAAQRETKFLEPTIVAAADHGRSAGSSRGASGFNRRCHSKGSVANFAALALISLGAGGLKVSAYIYAEQVFIAWACAGVVASPTLQRRVAFRIALRLR